MNLSVLLMIAALLLSGCDSGNPPSFRDANLDRISYTVATVAGTDADLGDDGPAADALPTFPYGVAVDDMGNVYIADTENHPVRKVDADGPITTFARTGESWPWENPDSIGDGGPATSARLRSPAGLAFDADGNLYVADSDHHRIHKVDAEGIITTVVGTGDRSFSRDDGPAADAQLGTPRGPEIDGEGNIYFTDTYGIGRIRKIDVVILDFYLLRTWGPIRPFETNAPLIVNANGILPFAICTESFQLTAWQRPQRLKRHCRIQDG